MWKRSKIVPCEAAKCEHYYYMHFCIVDVMLVTSISLMPVREVCYASKIINKFKN